MDMRAIIKTAKFVTLVPPQLKNNGAFTGNTYIDTQGLGALLIAIIVGTTDVIVGSTDTSHALKVEECDTTGGSYTDVTSAAMAAVVASTGDDTIYGISIDLTKSHKRYMRLNAPTAGSSTGANMCVLAIGFPMSQGPVTAAGMGLGTLVEA